MPCSNNDDRTVREVTVGETKTIEAREEATCSEQSGGAARDNSSILKRIVKEEDDTRMAYDDNDEMGLLVNSCRGVYDVGGVEFTCDRMGRFDCDDLEEIRNVNLTCAGNL